MQVFSNLHTLFYKLGGEQISYTYDYLNRLTRKTVGTTPHTYTYYAPYENLESALPHSILYQSTAGPVKEFQYTYDNLGNIKTTWERTGNSPLAKTGEYWYDRFNQLTREETAGQTRFYEYDTYGNLLWVERYNYIGFEDLQDARNAAAYIPSYNLGTDVYTYGDSEWKDLLTAYNGHAITYDAIGNPLTYYNGADYTMTWRQGRRLSNVTTGGQTINYEYDSEGKRTGKQVGTAQTTYLYAGGRLVSIEVHTPDYRIDLLYDESGVYGCIYNDASHTQTKYRFVKNAQGDIIQIRYQSDAVVANYTYDAWGALLSVTDENGAAITASAHIALRNPIRYRGYLYDSETGFYYVSSRYYDPEIGRWINADDAIAGVGGDVRGYNLFSYCMNNPVNMSDHTGHWPQWIKNAASAVVSAVKKAVTVVVNTVKSAVSSASNILKASSNSLPKKGEPGSSQTLPNPDGTPKQKRWYGPDGNPERDRDYNHPGNMPFPHDHEWKNGERGKDHLSPDPSYKMNWEPVIGVGLVFICTVGIIAVAADDVTVVGVADDFLFGPLGAGVGEGLIMIFG